MKRWFRYEFKPDHDHAHDLLLTIKGICDQLTQALASFAATAPTECQIAGFFEALYQMWLEAVQAITELRYYCDVLLRSANGYIYKRNPVCDSNFVGSECEAKINSLNCDLLEFNDGLTTMAAEAKGYLDLLVQSCDALYELADSFDSENRPSCDNSGGNVADNFENNFLGAFTARHDIAHDDQFVKIEEICDLLTQAIDSWINRN